MVTVEDAKDVAAFANFVVTPNAAVPVAPAAVPTPPPAAAVPVAPKVAKVVAAPPPPPLPVPVPAASVPTVVPPTTKNTNGTGPAGGGETLITTSPLAKRMALQQRAYLEKYGTTGYKPIHVAL
jgi:hypothetical protein